ncbi:MAG: FprA family A-type flavoprotein [Clostridia bacterium]|nr:FprA family A-type flavoprotein [Clostridia bacterium]
MNKQITKEITYIGVDDKTIDLFESQYVVPNGISYNSYLIKDEKNLVMDTVDKRATDEWYQNLQTALGGETIDYLVISHLEPDHAYNIQKLCDAYPNMKIIANQKIFAFIPQFFHIENLAQRKVLVGENDTISIGKHTLQFIMAPMVHWPEVMMTYEKTNKILFSADAFGKFGTLDVQEDWTCEARRYYFNIVGKYGIQVQAVLNKAKALDIKTICPLHGPVLTKDLGYYLEKYNIWSSYEPEDKGVTIAYASIHGNTKEAAEQLAILLKEAGEEKVSLFDLARDDLAEAIEDAFRYDKLVLAAASYNAEVFPPMQNFLHQLKGKNYQKRKIAIIENGTWAPSAAKKMLEIVEGMKDVTICEKVITIRSRMNEKNIEEMKELIKDLIK